MGKREEDDIFPCLMFSFTETISLVWYSCIAARIYISVIQQKDHDRQRMHVPLA